MKLDEQITRHYALEMLDRQFAPSIFLSLEGGPSMEEQEVLYEKAMAVFRSMTTEQLVEIVTAPPPSIPGVE